MIARFPAMLGVGGLVILAWAGAVRAADHPVDLELVLAADISHSMDLDEAELQRKGFADAIRHPAVIQAIQSGFFGRIAVTYMEWAGEAHQQTIVGWTEISGLESAAAFADAIEGAEVKTAFWTSISTVLDRAAASFEGNGYQGRRRIIDVSGDGPNNNGDWVDQARDRAVARGITINGLPIVNDRINPFGFPQLPNLDLYYEDCVIGGHGAFIVVAEGFFDFARAIRRKLILEIAGLRPARPLLYRAAERTRPPCDAGERQLRSFMSDFD